MLRLALALGLALSLTACVVTTQPYVAPTSSYPPPTEPPVVHGPPPVIGHGHHGHRGHRDHPSRDRNRLVIHDFHYVHGRGRYVDVTVQAFGDRASAVQIVGFDRKGGSANLGSRRISHRQTVRIVKRYSYRDRIKRFEVQLLDGRGNVIDIYNQLAP